MSTRIDINLYKQKKNENFINKTCFYKKICNERLVGSLGKATYQNYTYKVILPFFFFEGFTLLY